MNMGLPEMTALERQRAKLLEWQEEKVAALFQLQVHGGFYNEGGGEDNGVSTLYFCHGDDGFMGLREVSNQCNTIDPNARIEGWGQFGNIEVPCLGFGGESISRTASCPPAAVEPVSCGMLTEPSEKILQAPVRKDGFRKRKAERMKSTKDCKEEEREKNIKMYSNENDSKLSEQSNCNNGGDKKGSKNRNSTPKKTSESNSKDKSIVSDVQKTDYIHVRARRGQATDSHSLAERVRREKISEKMKFLQDLVPGCNKVTGKAGMLDEIINYVRSLQGQVEFLSMKLATVSPRLDLHIDDLFSKEMIPAWSGGFPVMDMSAELTSTAYFQLHPMHQAAPSSDLEMDIVNPNTSMERWSSGFQNIYSLELEQCNPTASAANQSLQQYTGLTELTSMKMEI
ncbi:hypothetical protein SAY86_014140 [Trapa natans]|uniref:BHLH domain-containing protein n=1 Tax=Trapa natans TaxID=22666 RepID=A0AAN7KSS4_TRANT|nr:hypothetical protein SAY86_014140 [Trapa natans]